MICIPEIKREEITLSCVQNDVLIEVRTTARTCNGLALHKGIGKNRLYRTLTHLPSSIPLVTGIRLPADEQDALLTELASLLDWSKSYDEIVSQWLHDPVLKERVQGLYARFLQSEVAHD